VNRFAAATISTRRRTLKNAAATDSAKVGSPAMVEVKGQDALTAVFEEAAVAPERVGAFRFYFDDERWEWSEQVQRMHGYQPGTVTPTTELVLAHKHPEDRDLIAQTIDTIRRTGQPLSSRHRIIDTSGKVRSVIVVGDELHDERGRVVGTQGFYIDATPHEREQQDQITAQLAEIAEHRAAIEQAKGVLMAAYGITANHAFDILAWRSQETNVKVRELASEFMAAISASHLSPESRSHVDHTLLTLS
jgi:PAS domain S-box-containing protein